MCMFLCVYVSMSSSFHISMFLNSCALLFLCFDVYMYPYIHAYMYPCFRVAIIICVVGMGCVSGPHIGRLMRLRLGSGLVNFC